MAKLVHLLTRFPEREWEIRRLFAHDPRFGEICNDYEEAMTALLGWQGPVRADEARAEEYRELAADLATEILATLDGSASRRPPHDKH